MIDVSVIMTVYNQAPYLEQAIKSVLAQKFSGNLELVIANDFSSDDSHMIIERMIKQNNSPHTIVYINNKQNIGMAENYKIAMENAKGRYLAFCEGDDYWVDSLKTQKQYNFLESNIDFNACVSQYQFLYEKNKLLKNSRERYFDNKSIFTLRDYIGFNFSHTSTFFIRNNFKLPHWIDNRVFCVDQSLIILSVKNKKIKYLQEIFSVYRMHDKNQTTNGVHQEKKNLTFKRNMSYFLDKMNEETNYVYNKEFNNRKKMNIHFWNFILAKNIFIKYIQRGLFEFYKYKNIKNL